MKSLTCIVSFTGIVALLTLTGCEGLKDPTAMKPDPVQKAPAEPETRELPKDLKPKTVGMPTMPKGAGKIDDDAPEEMTPTVTGLYYRILRKSDGKKPTAFDRVVAHYKGWLDDGTQFDSSYDRNSPSEFALNQVVKGWTEGLQLVGEGGMIELEIPYDLGYGVPGRPPSIPPKATLHFLVELKEVK